LFIALQIANHDKHVRIIDLSRNFGHHKAIITGISYSRGELVFVIDVDLEEDPEWLDAFYHQMIAEKSDVVLGVQVARKGNFFERISGYIFYKIFNRIARIEIPRNAVTARLMTRRFVEGFLKYKETEIFIAGLWKLTGFKQSEHLIIKKNKKRTHYTLRKRVSMSLDAIVSFSHSPLLFIFHSGVLITLLSVLFIIWLILKRLLTTDITDGWTSIIASVWFLGGVIIASIGIVGLYLSRIFLEVKNRPISIVRELYGYDPNR
jgi:putative glycosyltransferase